MERTNPYNRVQFTMVAQLEFLDSNVPKQVCRCFLKSQEVTPGILPIHSEALPSCHTTYLVSTR